MRSAEVDARVGVGVASCGADAIEAVVFMYAEEPVARAMCASFDCAKAKQTSWKPLLWWFLVKQLASVVDPTCVSWHGTRTHPCRHRHYCRVQSLCFTRHAPPRAIAHSRACHQSCMQRCRTLATASRVWMRRPFYERRCITSYINNLRSKARNLQRSDQVGFSTRLSIIVAAKLEKQNARSARYS